MPTFSLSSRRGSAPHPEDEEPADAFKFGSTSCSKDRHWWDGRGLESAHARRRRISEDLAIKKILPQSLRQFMTSSRCSPMKQSWPPAQSQQIIHIYDLGKTRARTTIAMEYIDGTT